MKKVSILILCLLFLCGCQEQAEPAKQYSKTVFAMDTVMELSVYGVEDMLAGAEYIITDTENQLSVTRPDSEIYRLNEEGQGKVSENTYALLEQALELCTLTDGALDISIYPVVKAWGFTTDEHRVPDANELNTLLQSVDYSKIELREGNAVLLGEHMQIDLGSVAKGWLGDAILDYFRSNGVESAMINLGGNVQALGAKSDGSLWRVAITDPSEEGYAGVVEIKDRAVITSGGYERYFDQDGLRYHHIIDPSTGYPADGGLLSVTIIGESGVTCDALSTALFVMGFDKATYFWKHNNGFEAIFITDNGICITEGLTSVFSPLGKYENTEVVILHRD